MQIFQSSYLFHPHAPHIVTITVGEVHLTTDFFQFLSESSHLSAMVLDTREDIREQAEKQRDVLSHQLGHHGLTHTLD